MAVISSQDTECTLKLKYLKKIYGRPVSIGKKRVGKVFDVIGNVETPFFVVRLSRSAKPMLLIGKTLSLK